MKEFLIYVRLFLKNKLLMITSVLFCMAVILLQIIEVMFISNTLDSFGEILGLSVWFLIFFLFISYEYFYKTRASGFDECAKTTEKYYSIYIKQFIVLMLLNTVIFFIQSLFSVIAYFKNSIGHPEALVHMILNYFVNIFLLGLLGILMGLFAALLLKRLTAYLFLTLFTLMTSQYGYSFALSLMSSKRINVFPIYEFFNLYSPAMNWRPNYHFGFSLLPYRIELFAVWICLFAAIILFIMSFHKFKKLLRILSAMLAVILLVNFVLYLQPSSKYNMSFNPNGSLWSDSYYYEEYYSRDLVFQTASKTAEFKATGYKMDIKIKNQLEAVVTVRTDSLGKYQRDNRFYIFTLYHGFKVSKITDGSGNLLNFEQRDDFITLNDSKTDLSNVKEFKFYYSGYHPKYYSNTQGICLPGHIVYYPIPGHIDLYDAESDGGIPVLLTEPVPFDVNIDYNKKVFCSLPKTESGTFSGITNGVTLLSGMLDSRTVNGIEIIYPYLDTDQGKKEYMENDVAQFLSAKVQSGDTTEIKKIMYLPSMNFRENEQAVEYSDYITAVQIRTLGRILYGISDDKGKKINDKTGE